MRYATVGTSWITESFIDASRMVEGFSLHSVYSRSGKKAEMFAERHQANSFYTDLGGLAKDSHVDCIYIASPNSLHYEHAMQFLTNGKHVICEKPIFSNTKELEEAYKVAEGHNVYLFEAMRNIHSPNFDVLRDRLPQAGTLRNCVLHRSRYSSKYDSYLQGDEPNVFTLAYSGGALVDMGIYPLYLAVALFGEPESISYHPVLLESGVDGSGTLILNYDNFTCTVMCSKITTSHIPCEICGEMGTFTFENAAFIDDLQFIDTETNHATSIPTNAIAEDMVYEIERFKHIILTYDNVAYQRLKALSLQVLAITEEARHQNGIVY